MAKTKTIVKSQDYGRLEDYIKEYFADRKDLNAFRDQVIQQMAAYEEVEAKRRQELLSRAEEPDEDGFITVVSKNPQAFQSEDETEADAAQAELPGLKVLPNFYRNSGKRAHEQRATQLEDLRRRFEEDKQKLAALKKAKLFQADHA